MMTQLFVSAGGIYINPWLLMVHMPPMMIIYGLLIVALLYDK